MNLSKIVDSIAAKAAESNPPNEQDYIVDGLLHCHKCGAMDAFLLLELGGVGGRDLFFFVPFPPPFFCI